jgi:FkbM family methyltransferase
VKFFSQVGQDQFLFEHFFRGKRGGVFVDIGAYDGEKFSNSLFFERSMGWTGLCVEPLPSAFARLCATRKAVCKQCCVADFEGEADFVEADAGIDEKMLSGLAEKFDPRHRSHLEAHAISRQTRRVQVRKLSSLLEEQNLYDIDLCSIDVEGAEVSILTPLDLQKFRISVFAIENDYPDESLITLMRSKGYDLVARLAHDCIFKRQDVQRLPLTTVFCSVWHGDPNRWELLRGHVANLAVQTLPLESIYVFDGGDVPPAWLKARSVTVHESLTIYQAWNIALSMVATPAAMNLNLDDRLAPDAVQVMQSVMARENAMLVAGDWNVRYTQADTDNVEKCYPVQRLPFVQAWPPAAGTVTRLGSGTGERGTLGPATMWRMEAHLTAPRYPWRASDGTLIRSAADAIWWMILKHQNRKIVRLPLVIGNYFSHPADQAEFRRQPYDELALVANPGISLT